MKPKYKKMLKVMKEKTYTTDIWFLYILCCNDGSLYTGITKDITRRVKMHQDGKASRYTRTRLPVQLMYQESCTNRTEALIRECNVKSFPRKKKKELIASQID